jgi:hypothetical protein
MSAEDWSRFDQLVAEASFRVSTQARAHGEVIAGLIEDRTGSIAGSSNWMDWESQKALRLLRPTH